MNSITPIISRLNLMLSHLPWSLAAFGLRHIRA